MRRVRRRLVETLIVSLLLALADPAASAVLNKRARLRAGPSRFTDLLDWVEPGVSVTVRGTEAGWYQVVLPDGRQGYVWGEHLDQIEGVQPAEGTQPGPSAAGTEAPAPPQRPTAVQDELRTLRAQLNGVSRGGGLVAKADLDRLIERIDRLAEEQQELRESLDDSAFTGVSTPVDGSAIAGGAFLTIGGIIGWVMARLTQRRRDRRSRIRL